MVFVFVSTGIVFVFEDTGIVLLRIVLLVGMVFELIKVFGMVLVASDVGMVFAKVVGMVFTNVV